MNAPDPLRALLAADSLRAILDVAAAGVVVQDEQGRIVDCNPAAEQLLGLSRAQMMGVTSVDPRWRALDAQGQDLPGDRHPAMHTLRTGEPVRDAVMGIALPEGGRRWILVHTNRLGRGDASAWVVSSFVDISAQRALEQTLESQTQRLYAALEGSRTATWQWNLQTGEAEADERWAEMFGWRLDELRPLTIDRFVGWVHPEDLPTAHQALIRHVKGELPYYDVECRVRHRAGHWLWVGSRGRITTCSADGRAEWMFGALDDITPRKDAELAAERQHGLVRALFTRAPIGMQLIDLALQRSVEVNDAMLRITGYSRDELLDGDSRRRFAPAARPVFDGWNRMLAEAGHFEPTEVEYIHASGRTINLVFSGSRVAEAAGGDHAWICVQDVTEYRAMERELRGAASIDRLTGLANRAAMLTELERRIARAAGDPARGFAVMFLDFDRFKLVNDTLGHDAGDELLCGIAQRLLFASMTAAGAGTDDGWLVARFGGDEFVILLPLTADAGGAGAEADRLLQVLRDPYEIKQQEIHSSASIGIALWSPGVATGDELLRDADTAMYEAKRAGRARWVLFDDTMRARLTRAVKVENELRYAVERGQLHAVYQPIVSLETGRMTSVEALLRWTHPELGAVSPAEFIPVAEESRHIVALGDWILREGCRQWAAWQREDPARAPATVSINLSRVQLSLGTRLLGSVRDALAEAGMPPGALQLEITEREFMKDPAAARALMQGLVGLGVKLAMDDFGTGTSSLACLRDYPFHTIKIDKSFVTGLSSDPHVLAVAHATVNVIENLGMASVAEGIEDPSEVATLQSLGCRYGQGHLFAQALPADAVLGAVQAVTG